jgi:hypothetical protein
VNSTQAGVLAPYSLASKSRFPETETLVGRDRFDYRTSAGVRPSICRHKFGDDNSGLWSEHGKRGAKREAHTQPADQYLRPIAGLNSLASNCRERLFGAAEAAVHQFVVAQPDREFGATLHETEFTASAGNLCHIEERPGDHYFA